MHHAPAVAAVAGLVALGVAGVLERHPAVAGLRQRAHHLAVQVAGLDLAHVAAGRLGLPVGRVERRPPQVGQRGHLVRVDQRPQLVGLDPAHELVRDPVGQVQVVGAPRLLAGVVLELEELLDVGVPRLQVDAGGALAAAALVHRRDRGVERPQERHDPVGGAVGAADQRAAGADPRPGDADAAGELAQPGHLRVPVVNRAQVVQRRVDQEAGRHLRVAGARVEQRRRARQVGQRGHHPVEADRLRRRPAEPAGHPEQEVLRGLEDQAGGRVAQQVAVVDGLDAEVLELPVRTCGRWRRRACARCP